MTLTALSPLVGLGHGLRFTESPRWRQDRLWFIDIHDSAVTSVSLAGDLRTEIVLPFKPNGLGFLADGNVVFSDALHLAFKRWDGSVLHNHADLSSTSVFCLSDAIADDAGRIFVGDIGYNFWNPDAAPVDSCVITRIESDGSVTKAAEGLSFPNGMVITDNGKTLAIAETNGFRLTAFDIGTDGVLSNRRIWAQLPKGVQPVASALMAKAQSGLPIRLVTHLYCACVKAELCSIQSISTRMRMPSRWAVRRDATYSSAPPPATILSR